MPAPRERPLPGPKGRHLIGSLMDVRRDRLKFVTQVTQQYGDLICFRMGWKNLYLLNHPDHARHILCDNVSNYRKGLGLAEARPLLGNGLLTSDGDLWASQRRLLQAAFQNKYHEEFCTLMGEATLLSLERWQDRARSGDAVDVAREMVILTITILGFTLFRADLSERAIALSNDLTLLSRWAMSRMTSLVRLPIGVPSRKNYLARQALKRLESHVEQMIREHDSRCDRHREDLISLLASDCEENGVAHNKQMRDEIMTLLLAGHETTAATLSWTWYLLSQHPEVERRVQAEVDELVAGRIPTLSDLQKLVYTKMVIYEVLRLYPPVWLLPRKAINDDFLDQHRIPANSDVLLCVYTLHRHAGYWRDAERFDPERFATEECAQRVSNVYLPFGAGPRTCIGSRFGLIEVLLVVALIAQRFSWRLCAGQKVETEASLTLRPRHGLQMTLHSRV